MVDAKARALGLDTLFTGFAIGYVFLFFALVWLVVVVAKSNKARAIGTAIVFLVFSALPIRIFVYETPAEKEYRARQASQQKEWKANYEAAKPIFDKLCAEQSQPIIKRTVEDVEGVLLLKVRPVRWYPPVVYPNVPDWPEAALPGFGRESEGSKEGYPESFLMDWTWGESMSDELVKPMQWRRFWSVGGMTWEDSNAKAGESRKKRAFPGFQYVDVLDNDGITRVRITARNEKSKTEYPYPGVVFSSTVTKQPAPRYGVTFEDNLDSELRKYWIAGMTIKVIDTDSNEVIGQRSFWSWDRGFGATGQVVPWSTNVTRCPIIADPMGLVYSTVKPVFGNKS